LMTFDDFIRSEKVAKQRKKLYGKVTA